MMKIFLISIVLFVSFFSKEQVSPTGKEQMPLTEEYQPIPFGSIKPSGWLKTQMQKDMEGFVGNLDRLVPELINDPIYGSERRFIN